jgi:hypothetical protein
VKRRGKVFDMRAELSPEGRERSEDALRAARGRARAEVERVAWALAALETALREIRPEGADRTAALRAELMVSLAALAEPERELEAAFGRMAPV